MSVVQVAPSRLTVGHREYDLDEPPDRTEIKKYDWLKSDYLFGITKLWWPGQNRTADTRIFNCKNYHLYSVLGSPSLA